MSDQKISQLPDASVPLDGTELVPLVQSNSTAKVTVANLLSGAGAVTSVNGQTGVVDLGYADLSGAIPTWDQNTTGTAAGLSETLVVASGGTGAITASGARTELGAAASGANTDITSVALTTGSVSTSPSANSDIANKSYVDGVAQGLDIKSSVVVATTVDIALSGTLQTIDGYIPGATERVLVKNQTLTQNNGIYVVAAGAWTRSTDMDAWTKVPGAFVFVEAGTSQADTGWVCTSNAGGTLGTTPITWTQFSGAGAYSASTGLTLTGTAFSIDSTVATLTGAQTLTNKTLTAPILGSPTSGNFSTGTFTWPTFNQDTTGTASTVTSATQSAITTTSNLTIVGALNSGSITSGFGSIDVGTDSISGGTITGSNDANLNGLTVGKGAGSGTSSTAVGYGVLAANVSGNYNTGNGYWALASNTSGNFNTASGETALNANLNGSNNTAIGYSSLTNNESGAGNTAIGAQTFVDSISASYNTAVGYQAGRYTTTGATLVAVGSTALYQNTTGSSNTGVGSSALYANTTGSGNVAIGVSTLSGNVLASNNTVVGNSAGYTSGASTQAGSFIVGGSYTITNIGTTNFTLIGAASNTVGLAFTATGVGTGTGSAAGNASSNTFVGSQSGYYVATGSKNTILGNYNGNQGSLDLRIANNYIVLSDGDGNPRAYWNAANATFNGSLQVNGTLSATETNITGVGALNSGSITSGFGSIDVGADAISGGSLAIDTDTLYVDSTNNRVGIGTTSPAAKLDVFGSAGLASRLLAFTGYNSSSDVRFDIGASNSDTVNNSATYAWKLETKGDAAGQSLTIGAYRRGDTTLERARIDSSGDLTTTNERLNYITVGRGAGAVSTNTAVGASALAANTSGARNAAFGLEALRLTTTGNDNSAFGVDALYSNTTGASNTAIGKDALVYSTTASSNTAVGYQAGYSNTTGANNAYLGKGAGYTNVNGSNNVGIGPDATNGSGDNNTGVGASALTSNTSGTRNAALGQGALQSNTTGNYNVAVGMQAMVYNTTASNNTAVGYQAGYSNTTGGSNTSLGIAAGYSCTVGAGNLFVGRDAGGSLTSGNYNTFVGGYASGGFGAGYYVTTGSKNTILGGYNGNQGGLNITQANNYIVLSDGDGAPRLISDGSGNWMAGRTNRQNNGKLEVLADSGAQAIVAQVQSNGNSLFQGFSSSGGSAVFQVTGNGDLGTNTVTLYQGALTFPAAQVASSDANTLDDYEEGTWTPNVTIGGSSTGITYSARAGTYTKVGNLVQISFIIRLTSRGSNTGDVAIDGLPFIKANDAVGFGHAYVGTLANMAALNSTPFGGIPGNTATIAVRQLDSASAGTTDPQITQANISNSWIFGMTAVYTTST